MGIEVLFKYKQYKSVIRAHRCSQICGEVERHLRVSQASVNPTVVCTTVCDDALDLLSGPSVIFFFCSDGALNGRHTRS